MAMKSMRKMASIWGLTLAVLMVATLSIPIMGGNPIGTRKVQVNSSTAVTISKANTRTGTLASADSNTVFALDANASTTADFYTGLTMELSGASCPANGYSGLITSYAADTNATVSPATAADPNTACTFTVGPGLPMKAEALWIGNASGTIYIAFNSGSASDAARRITIPGGTWMVFPKTFVDRVGAIDILSNSATDTVEILYY